MRPPTPLSAAIVLSLAACGDVAEPDLPRPLAISGATPFTAGCNGAPQSGIRYASAEVEPSLAVDPTGAGHLVAAWQQDRWSNGGADGLVAGVSFDGGLAWTRTPVPLSRCAGGSAGRGGDYERASDPWVTIGPDGVVHLVGLGLSSGGRAAILVSRSTDGGLTWSDAQALAADADPEFLVDKPSITADPGRPGTVYAVWDRLTGQTIRNNPAATGPAWFSRSTDAGATWEAARPIYDPGPDAQTISSQIVVLPGGSLVDVFVRIRRASAPDAAAEVAAMRSADAGVTWSEPTAVGALLAVGAVDPKTGHAIRGGEVVPSTAVDPASGAIAVAWQDARFGGGARDGIVLARSPDGGLTWPPPRPVNGAPAAQAFRPAVAVGSLGRIAVTYYDLRFDSPFDPARLWATFWRAISDDGGATWDEVPQGGPFDLRGAPDAGGFFVGDYTGLVPRGAGFLSVFALATAGGASGPTDVYASAPAVAAPIGGRAEAEAQRNVSPALLRERLRALRERPR